MQISKFLRLKMTWSSSFEKSHLGVQILDRSLDPSQKTASLRKIISRRKFRFCTIDGLCRLILILFFWSILGPTFYIWELEEELSKIFVLFSTYQFLSLKFLPNFYHLFFTNFYLFLPFFDKFSSWAIFLPNFSLCFYIILIDQR